MEKFEEARDKAIKNLKIADHMLTQTYPSVKDPKLLLAVMENLFLSLTNAMGAILHYEVIQKRINQFDENFESKYNIFKLKVAPGYKINKDYVKLVGDVKNIVIAHKKSPVEFARKDAFVICDDNYAMRALSANEMKAYVEKTKGFVQEMQNITSQRR